MTSTILTLSALTAFSYPAGAHNLPVLDSLMSIDGFKVELIDRQVKEFTIDSIHLSSPMDNFLSRTWLRLTGKNKYWGDISSASLSFDYEEDSPVEDYVRDYVLNEQIDYVVTYRDSVACIITHTPGEDIVFLNNCQLENGRWVNTGQGLADDFEDAFNMIKHSQPKALYNLPRIGIIDEEPTDLSPFVNFLKSVHQSPEEFILDMLTKHKLVINGEFHRRKASWDMLNRLISMPGFADITGCVFMELPSRYQSLMDQFMNAEVMDTDLIIHIFQNEQLNGWWDRGEFEFICNLWHLNHNLPEEKRIKVMPVDYQIPYSDIASAEDARAQEDRNTHMAQLISKSIGESQDPRNNLLLVGCGHVCKSRQQGYASAEYGKEAAFTAGTQLTDMLGAENVFTIFQHALSGDNSGNNKTPLRGGIFDEAFKLNGNHPVGFNLVGSPFGEEPFDGLYELKYNTDTGTYKDNFDGYIFLGALESEPKAVPLIEIFTDEFVAEMKRRARVMGLENARRIWFGRTAPELTREYITDILMKE